MQGRAGIGGTPLQHLQHQRELVDNPGEAADHTDILSAAQTELLGALVTCPLEAYRRTNSALLYWRQRRTFHNEKLMKWKSSLPVEKQQVVGKLNPFLLEEMLDHAGHADKQFVTNLLEGFPVTGTVGVGGLGEDIPGGQRSRGRPGGTGPLPLEELRKQCAEMNEDTLRKARGRLPRCSEEWVLAEAVWNKTSKDIESGRAGAPCELHDVDLSRLLLVDCFGIWEQHGEAAEAKVRGIHNFRSNLVNDCAWLPQKFKYHGFMHMFAALQALAGVLAVQGSSGGLQMGKTDFRSAFKTLPAASDQSWLCWALVFNTDAKRLQAVPLWSQVFGSLGGVTGWYRTARAIQCVLCTLFFVLVFFYVDDVFWAATDTVMP